MDVTGRDGRVLRRARARLALAVCVTALPALVGISSSAAAEPVFVLSGRGHGHGVGLAQDSARAMAATGADHEKILSHFYPGTLRGRRSSLIRVAVWEAEAGPADVTTSVPSGARISSEGRSVSAAPGAVLRLTVDGSGYHVREVRSAPAPRPAAMRAAWVAAATPSPSPSQGGGPLPNLLPSVAPSPAPSRSPAASPAPGQSPPPASSAPRPGASPSSNPAPGATPTGAPVSFDSRSPVTLTPAGGGVVAVAATGRRYRGELLAIARQGFRLVNVLDVEEYLRGLGEVPASWPPAALRAQAVAARTYALRSVAAGAPLGYDLCDDTRCQVYLGVQAESPRTTAAARDTRGEVVTYGGGLADTFYSANAGGVTATPGEGFGGSTAIPYLPGGVRAPGEVDPWRLSASPQDIAARLGYPGRLERMTVTERGPSGRATAVELHGSSGLRKLTGVETARRLGLRSTLFTVTQTSGTAQALPPAVVQAQLPPTQVAAVLAQPTPEVAPADETDIDQETASASSLPTDAPPWTVTVAGLLLVVAVFGAVLARRAHLNRVRAAAHRAAG